MLSVDPESMIALPLDWDVEKGTVMRAALFWLMQQMWRAIVDSFNSFPGRTVGPQAVVSQRMTVVLEASLDARPRTRVLVPDLVVQ